VRERHALLSPVDLHAAATQLGHDGAGLVADALDVAVSRDEVGGFAV